MDTPSFFKQDLARRYPIGSLLFGWTITRHEMKLETPYVACAEVTFVRNGRSLPYLLMLTKPGVAALITTADGSVVLTKQTRFGARTAHWELPQETLEENEKSQDAVKRLIAEETGQDTFVSSEKMPFSVAAAPHRMTEVTDIYHVKILEFSPTKDRDLDEIDSVQVFPLTKIASMIEKGEIDESVTLSALGWHLAKSRAL